MTSRGQVVLELNALLGIIYVVLAEETKTLLLVDVGVSYRHGDGVDGNVHHDNVKNPVVS
jgi:hypothetical protein